MVFLGLKFRIALRKPSRGIIIFIIIIITIIIIYITIYINKKKLIDNASPDIKNPTSIENLSQIQNW